MKVTSEEFTKLVGPNGERFTSEGEYREPKVGEYFMNSDGGVCIAHVNGYDKIVLTRAKTAREWLSELPDGWREEALAHCKNPDDFVDSWESALFSVNWVHSNSGVYAWDEVALAIKDGKRPLPPHPSKAKPKVERLGVVESVDRFLWAGNIRLDGWLGRADFRGFVYVLPNGEEACGVASTLIWWSDETQDWKLRSRDSWTNPLRPKFVELAK